MFAVRNPHSHPGHLHPGHYNPGHSHHGHFHPGHSLPEFRGRNWFDLEPFFGRQLLVHERPWSVLAREAALPVPVPTNSGKKSQFITLTDDKFEVKLDVSKYTPAELSVKVVENSLVIEGKHEEKDDPNNFVSHNFIRKFPLPEGIILDQMTSSLITEGGFLVISAPRHIEKPKPNETKIPITFVGHENQPAAAAVPEDKSEVSQEEKEEDNKSTN